MRETDLAAGELSVYEADLTAGEPGTAGIASIEDNPREVDIQTLPGHRRFFLDVRGDYPDDSMADSLAGLEGKSLRLGRI